MENEKKQTLEERKDAKGKDKEVHGGQIGPCEEDLILTDQYGRIVSYIARLEFVETFRMDVCVVVVLCSILFTELLYIQNIFIIKTPSTLQKGEIHSLRESSR